MVDGEGLEVRLRQAGPIPLDAALGCKAGEVLALVGPSGSGKTTILRCIAGLARPREGLVACDGAVWFDAERGVDRPPQRRSVGLVFQHYALFPHLSALDTVMAAMGHVPRRERAQRARLLLETVHLPGLGDRRPAALSGGQQQRVALARALARDPAVLLLDEPFSAVDLVTRRKLRRELAQLRGRVTIPIVLVTHDLEEAAMLADRMCILHRGRTLQDGPPAEVLTRPRDALVARLVDVRNLFEGLVLEHRAEAGHTLIRWLGYTLEARQNPAYAPGQKVCWAVPSGHIVLHRRDRPSRGEHENPVAGVIAEFVVLGENASVTALIDGRADSPVSLSVPTHVARRNGLGPGAAIKLSLLADGIYLMAWERLEVAPAA
ncbi:MAG: ABC transporter ATP-binding protein [Pseudomonadota bacterium]